MLLDPSVATERNFLFHVSRKNPSSNSLTIPNIFFSPVLFSRSGIGRKWRFSRLYFKHIRIRTSTYESPQFFAESKEKKKSYVRFSRRRRRVFSKLLPIIVCKYLRITSPLTPGRWNNSSDVGDTRNAAVTCRNDITVATWPTTKSIFAP